VQRQYWVRIPLRSGIRSWGRTSVQERWARMAKRQWCKCGMSKGRFRTWSLVLGSLFAKLVKSWRTFCTTSYFSKTKSVLPLGSVTVYWWLPSRVMGWESRPNPMASKVFLTLSLQEMCNWTEGIHSWNHIISECACATWDLVEV